MRKKQEIFYKGKQVMLHYCKDWKRRMGTMNFIKISSDFEILAKQKRQHKNGIHLRSLMIFYLMCKYDGETIGECS